MTYACQECGAHVLLDESPFVECPYCESRFLVRDPAAMDRAPQTDATWPTWGPEPESRRG